MIIFYAKGRLGNQLFQYMFLKTIQRNNEKILVSGFEELKEVFEIEDILILSKQNRWIKLLYSGLKRILHFLANTRLISSIEVNHEIVLEKYRRESITTSEKKGLIDFVRFVKLGYFQSESFFDKKVTTQLNIKDKYLDEADQFLQQVPVHSNKVFVHIRKGDYKHFSIYEKETLLPITYFKKQIEWFLKNRENNFFIFLSDEPEFIEEEFKDIKNKLISTKLSHGTDMAIMTKCNSAILSPSSFGWWGSYLMSYKDVVFAPKYWLGFNSSEEFHSHPLANFMIKIEILNQEKSNEKKF